MKSETKQTEHGMRLQKFLARAGVCSRRTGEEYIRAGRVSVNGAVVTEPGVKIDAKADRVAVDGKPVRQKPSRVYIALHKPEGYVTSCKQPQEKIVLSLIDLNRRVVPVGRLDKDSTGLLLLTDDGGLHHRLTHPGFDHEKEYIVRTWRPLSNTDLRRMAEGIELDGSVTRPAQVRRLGPKKFKITLQEGRNRQIRRMVGALKNGVASLKRVRIGNIKLGELPEGAWRFLTDTELEALYTPADPKRKGGRKRPQRQR
jgi:23S rRNA pseudouridine2605 synthase/23S rRNA pseudouridine2604 synthase